MPLPDLTDAELMESRKLLLHFARLQLPDHPDLAEDLVQEHCCRIQRRRQFQGRALVNSWLFAILKNKIIDALRQIGRQRKVLPHWMTSCWMKHLKAIFPKTGIGRRKGSRNIGTLRKNH
ncbi:sigma-70 region 2 family protein [Neisseria gonorrhoeae]|nr:sigma-70 region 2 family protein [Neisseria gonorrhoeae]